MTFLSTGEPSTLGTYRRLCAMTFGENSGPVKYFDQKIKEQGAEAEVLADESQMMALIYSLLN